MDKGEFRAALHRAGHFDAHQSSAAILHQGACSNTLEDDGRYMMDNNFDLLEGAVCTSHVDHDHPVRLRVHRGCLRR